MITSSFSPLSFRSPLRLFLLVIGGALVAEIPSLPALADGISVPGAQRAIERYEDAVAKAEAGYKEADERASERWDERAFLQRASVAYGSAMREATVELTGELERIEKWLLDQVERMRKRREVAEARLEAAMSPQIFGKLHIVVRGRAEVFRNGSLVIAMEEPKEINFASAPIRVRRGDLLVFRVESAYVNRSFRAAIAGEDGAQIAVTTPQGLRRVQGDLNPASMTAGDFNPDWPRASLGRIGTGMDEQWATLRLKEDDTQWVGIPGQDGAYLFAYLIP